jgi:hypothetical protein
MPYQKADPSDPNVLVGVSLPGARDDLRRMAEVFVEEFAALGFDEKRILLLFRHPGYVAAHRAWRELGDVEIRRIARDCMAPWARLRVSVSEPALDDGRGAPRDLVPLGSRPRDRRPGGR